MQLSYAEKKNIEQKIFDKVMKAKPNSDPELLKKYIKFGNIHGDGYKRVSLISNPDVVFLVPIEDFFLRTIKGSDLGTRYKLVEKEKI